MLPLRWETFVAIFLPLPWKCDCFLTATRQRAAVKHLPHGQQKSSKVVTLQDGFIPPSHGPHMATTGCRVSVTASGPYRSRTETPAPPAVHGRRAHDGRSGAVARSQIAIEAEEELFPPFEEGWCGRVSCPAGLTPPRWASHETLKAVD